jgi:hypothetical protein
VKPPLRAFAALLISAGVLAGCLPGAEERFREKLVRLLDGDLETICGEIQVRDASALLDRPYYRIVEYKATPNSGSYSHLCEADFYYLKTIKMKQMRKYRYNPNTGEWERYWKQIITLLPGSGKP